MDSDRLFSLEIELYVDQKNVDKLCFDASELAEPPTLVSKEEMFDIDIDMVGSYWSFPSETYLRRCAIPTNICWQVYKNVVQLIPKKLQFLHLLSGKKLGCANVAHSHGNMLLHLYNEQKYTYSDVWQSCLSDSQYMTHKELAVWKKVKTDKKFLVSLIYPEMCDHFSFKQWNLFRRLQKPYCTHV